VVVDAGSRGSLPVIKAGLNALGVTLDQIRLIALTHSHPDHAGGLAELAEASSAEVAIHHLEAGIVSGEAPRPSFLRRERLPQVPSAVSPIIDSSPVKVDYPLNDGDYLPGIDGVRAIHTPGHTPGSTCYYVESAKAMIVGDALQYRFRKLQPSSWFFTRDPEQAKQSLAKLLETDFEKVCFSHFPPIKENARAMLAEFLQASQ
jgi:glyoxylase-like metal-dependent hydrolase (beta-lactamase superfamily II)